MTFEIQNIVSGELLNTSVPITSIKKVRDICREFFRKESADSQARLKAFCIETGECVFDVVKANGKNIFMRLTEEFKAVQKAEKITQKSLNTSVAKKKETTKEKTAKKTHRKNSNTNAIIKPADGTNIFESVFHHPQSEYLDVSKTAQKMKELLENMWQDFAFRKDIREKMMPESSFPILYFGSLEKYCKSSIRTLSVAVNPSWAEFLEDKNSRANRFDDNSPEVMKIIASSPEFVGELRFR